MTALRSYRDVLVRKERQRPDGQGPVWPLRPSDLPSHHLPAASVAPALATPLPPQHDDEAVVLPTSVRRVG